MGKKNTEEKGEIARYEQFLLFPQCFQKSCLADACLGKHETLFQTCHSKPVTYKKIPAFITLKAFSDDKAN